MEKFGIFSGNQVDSFKDHFNMLNINLDLILLKTSFKVLNVKVCIEKSELKNWLHIEEGFYNVHKERKIFYANIKIFSCSASTTICKGTKIATATFKVILNFHKHKI